MVHFHSYAKFPEGILHAGSEFPYVPGVHINTINSARVLGSFPKHSHIHIAAGEDDRPICCTHDLLRWAMELVN